MRMPGDLNTLLGTRCSGKRFALLLALPWVAAQAAPISVLVVDKRGPIAYADLTVSMAETRALVADGDGRAVLPARLPGVACQLTVSARGFRRVAMPCPDIAETTITLRARATEDVVVVARRMSAPFAPKSFDQMEIFADPGSRADPLGIVNSLPYSTNVDGSGDVALRGSAASLNRVYLNDVPFYEALRGSRIDRITRGRSILNPVVVEHVEVHPMNAPLYLAGAAAGAVRLLPQDQGVSSTNVLVSLAGAGATHSRSFRGGSHMQAFGTIDHMGAMRRLNPTLAETTRHWRGRELGLSGQLSLAGAGKLTAYNATTSESGAWPLHVLATSADYATSNERRAHVLSHAIPFAKGRLKLDFGHIHAARGEQFGNYRYRNRNRYTYQAVDWVGQAGRAQYRAGIARQAIALSSVGEAPAFPTVFDATAPARPASHFERENRVDAFLYSVVAGEVAEVQLGLRHSIDGTPDFTSLQAGVSLDRGASRWIVSGGRYFGYDVPWAAHFSDVTPVESRQLGFDWLYSGTRLTAGVGLFRKTEQELTAGDINAQRHRIHGGDAFAAIDIGRSLSLRVSLTRAEIDVSMAGQRFPAEDTIDYVARLRLDWRLNATTSFGFAFATRNGTRYTPVVGVTEVAPATFQPTFSRHRNTSRLGRFATLDLNFATRVKLWHEALQPLLFVGFANALNRENLRGIGYSSDYRQIVSLAYPGRTAIAGLVFIL